MKRLFILVVSVISLCCGCSSSQAQVIPGSNGVNAKRCDWILNHFHNRLSFSEEDLKAFSEDFAAVLADYSKLDDYDMPQLLGALGNEETLLYWYLGSGYDFSDNAKESYSFVEGADRQAKILVRLQEAYYDENGDLDYEEEDTRTMCLVKENGRWVMDDWLNSVGSSMKDALREYVDQERDIRYVRYTGKMLEKPELGQFTVVLRFGNEENDNGEVVWGAYRFDNKEEEEPLFTEVIGVLKDGGDIYFYAKLEDGGQSIFSGTITPDLTKITGSWLLYDAAGDLASDSDMTMENF